ncbi:uncharacterized protein V6R79_010049 [Siganus canaliculatus]
MRAPVFACLLRALFFCQDGEATGESTASGHALHNNDGNFSSRDHMNQEPVLRQQQVLDALSGSAFDLKIQVNDVLSRQKLSQAVVEVYINYTRVNTALTGEDGGVLLHVPYQNESLITIVASKEGYIFTVLPCKTSRMPIFSSMTMSLLGLDQGNIWLFDDSVLITGKTSDVSSQPIIKFPKSLLNLTDGSDVTSVKAYLTIPRLPSEDDSFLNTPGIMSTQSGYISVELSPVAAVSVQLFSGDTELHVNGPVQISLRVPDAYGLQTSSVVPAWFYNSSTGFISIDLIWQHSPLLMVIFGGMLVVALCLLVGLLVYHRCRLSKAKIEKTLPINRKDQTTSTSDSGVFNISPQPQDRQDPSFSEQRDTEHSVIANPSAVAVTVECSELEFHTDPNDVTAFNKTTEQIRFPESLTENLFFYNHPVAILHASAFFHLEEQPEETQWSRSATLPRAGATNGAPTEPLSKDTFTQNVPKGPSAPPNQTVETEDQLGVLDSAQEAASRNKSRGHFSLPESVSVPGTLSKIGGNRHSMHTLTELSKMPSLQPPRAWFVSLEGKPAAEIHYAVSEQQRRRRPVERRETSLDSGVDMSELNQAAGRRTVTLERNATFVKSTSSSKRAPSQ